MSPYERPSGLEVIRLQLAVVIYEYNPLRGRGLNGFEASSRQAKLFFFQVAHTHASLTEGSQISGATAGTEALSMTIT